ncbi:hypothetical protein BDB01DRAFT_784906 [Pilobolus umbonatus]|nr:hypothetical protein BDB01DRAFT_784906 [Pilobolus umbonatus]
MDLVLAKGWKGVTYQCIRELDQCVLTGCEPGTDDLLVIIPVSYSIHDLSMKR